MKKFTIFFTVFLLISAVLISLDKTHTSLFLMALFAIFLLSSFLMLVITFIYFVVTSIKNKKISKQSIVPIGIVVLALSLSYGLSVVINTVQSNNDMKLREEIVLQIIDDEITANEDNTYVLDDRYANLTPTNEIYIYEDANCLVVIFNTDFGILVHPSAIAYVQGENYEQYIPKAYYTEIIKENWYDLIYVWD